MEPVRQPLISRATILRICEILGVDHNTVTHIDITPARIRISENVQPIQHTPSGRTRKRHTTKWVR